MTAFKATRVDESRQRVWEALLMAFASYIEQEGKKGDGWREESLGALVSHLQHEVEEVSSNLRRQEIGFLLHNAMDVISLGALILAKAREHGGIR